MTNEKTTGQPDINRGNVVLKEGEPPIWVDRVVDPEKAKVMALVEKPYRELARQVEPGEGVDFSGFDARNRYIFRGGDLAYEEGRKFDLEKAKPKTAGKRLRAFGRNVLNRH